MGASHPVATPNAGGWAADGAQGTARPTILMGFDTAGDEILEVSSPAACKTVAKSARHATCEGCTLKSPIHSLAHRRGFQHLRSGWRIFVWYCGNPRLVKAESGAVRSNVGDAPGGISFNPNPWPHGKNTAMAAGLRQGLSLLRRH